MPSWFRGAAVALALVGSALAADAAKAQSLTFAGTADGCFGANCTVGQNTTDKGLSFTGSSFSVKTANNFAMIGSLTGTNNLGRFSLAIRNTTDVYNDVFKLAITFTSPTGTSPNVGVYSSVLMGQVDSDGAGGVTITLQNTTLPFTYPGGAFTLRINNEINITPGESNVVSGFIMASPILATPGPIAGAGLPVLLGLAGLAFYRRRSAANAA